jgi:prephenate dehydrogenase
VFDIFHQKKHDEVAALVSHLPHLLAADAYRDRPANAAPMPSPSADQDFADTTRVASGPPAMWAEILQVESCRCSQIRQRRLLKKRREIINTARFRARRGRAMHTIPYSRKNRTRSAFPTT